MPVLISNYTIPDVAPPRLANPRYQTEYWKSSSNIVIASNWQNGINARIHQLLDEYSTLKNNWDEDGALAPKRNVVRAAKNLTILLEIYSQKIFHSAPGPDGEIMLDIRNDQKSKSIEVIFYPNHSVIVFFPETGNPHQEPFDINNLSDYLTWLHQK